MNNRIKIDVNNTMITTLSYLLVLLVPLVLWEDLVVVASQL